MDNAVAAKSAPPERQRRKLQYYHPCVWGDFFLTHVFETDEVVTQWNEEIQVLKSEIERMMMMLETAESSPERLNLVDAIQRLGIGYLFEPEIERLLQHEVRQTGNRNVDDDNIHTVALRFRILKQHGHNAPSEVFKKFKDKQGKFTKEVTDDIEGMLSLYEAAFMRVDGDTILDEAIEVTKAHLTAKVDDDKSDDSPLTERVARALKCPLRKDMEKLQHVFFISNYGKIQGHNHSLLKLAKLSFNVLQNQYQKELKVLTKWWTDLGFSTELLYARDRLVETYLWSVGMLWEPKYSLARYLVTKSTALGTVLDDTYDIYGHFDELELVTSKIARWDTGTDDLDIKLKLVIEAVMDFNHEIHAITSDEGRPYCFDYAKRVLTIALTAYLDEQRWYATGSVPSLEEYRQVSGVSTTYLVIVAVALCGIGESASKEVFDWLLADPKLLQASTDHCRLMDDIVTHEREQDRGHAPSSVQIYMEQSGATVERAIHVLSGIVDDNWRTMNRETLLNGRNVPEEDRGGVVVVPMEVRLLILRCAQIMEVMYKEYDGYTCSNTVTKDRITALFLTPMPL